MTTTPSAAGGGEMSRYICSNCSAALRSGYTCDECGSDQADEVYVPAKPGMAHFSYELNSASGYEQTGTVHNITPEQFGEVTRVLHSADFHSELRALIAAAEKQPGASMDGELCDALADARALLGETAATGASQ